MVAYSWELSDWFSIILQIWETFTWFSCKFWLWKNKTLDEHIQFHWKFETTNSRFWLVMIQLRKFDTSSKKEIKMIKTQILWGKTTTKAKKYIKALSNIFYELAPLTRDDILQTLERKRKHIGVILSDEHTQYIKFTNPNPTPRPWKVTANLNYTCKNI